MLTLDNVYRAHHRLKKVIRKTDLIYAHTLSSDNDIYLKTENLQVTGSFKVRGASYKISCLTDEEKQKGVIACSAGNHAQGVALACKVNGVKSKIFIPSIAPISKVEATKAYGAEVVLVDGIYDDAYQAALVEVEKTGAVFVHPFNDEDVIAGQGTIGLELLEDLPNMDAVVVPIGGGGLIAGVAFTLKQLNPDIRVYGVQACGASAMLESVYKCRLTSLPSVSTFADGIAVREPGDITYDYCAKYVDKIVSVTDDETATAILTLMENEKVVAEGAGAVSVAAMLFDKIPEKNSKVVCLVSGGNIDVTILSRVIHRGLLTSGRISDLTIELLDKPGQLKEISTIIADLGANVIKVNHERGGQNTDINGCYINLSMETRNHAHFDEIKEALLARNYHLLENYMC
jgi:threonine dehydratase